MTITLQRLQLLRDRLLPAYNFEHQQNNNNYICNNDNDVDYTSKNTLPLFQVIEAVQNLLFDGEIPPNIEWTHSLIRRIERTLRGMPKKISHASDLDYESFVTRQYLIKPWKLYLDESHFILAERDYGPDGDSIIWKRHLRVCEFENELERRRKQFESVHVRRKTFSELCEKHRVSLAEYLTKCFTFHSSVSVQDLCVEHQNEENVKYTEDGETVKTENSTFKTIEIPLRLLSSRLSKSVLSSSNIQMQTIPAVPFIPSLKETFVESDESIEYNLTEVIRTYRWILILGNPGYGKTTLLRWLLLQFVRSLVRRNKNFDSIGLRLDKWQRLAIRFGSNKALFTGCSIRLPIIVRIGELITWLNLHPTSTIMDYFGHLSWFTASYVENEHHSFLCDFIHHGHAFLLFDGLDEVSNYDERKRIVHLIETFVEEHVRTPAHISISDREEVVNEWGGLNCEQPDFVGGNQIIITSRVVGYYLYPIRSAMFSLFTLNTMDEKESRAFVNHWLLHVPYGITHSMYGKNDSERTKVIRKKKETYVKEVLCASDEKVWCHPMLLKLVLPLLYRTTTDIIHLGSRVQLYHLTVRYILNAWEQTCESLWPSETVSWLLYDMALYIHVSCPSGLIDKFDLTCLFNTSLMYLYKHKTISRTDRLLKSEAEELVRRLVTNSMGFVVAQGLDAYGFAHLTFQEYFVALSIVRPRIGTAVSVLDSLFARLIKMRFRESLTLALEWISWTWKAGDFDKFCTELSQKSIGSLPIGALFLSSILANLSNVPGLEVLSHVFTSLASSSFNPTFLEYLVIGVSKMKSTSNTLIEYLFNQNTNHGALCRFFAHSLVKTKNGQFVVPNWLSKSYFLRLELYDDVNEIVQTTIDSVLRQVRDTYKSEELRESNSLFDHLIARKSNIHPKMLSLLMVLCGGLHYAQPELNFTKNSHNLSEHLHFSPNRMHRSTAISDILLSYFIDEKFDIPNGQFENIIQQCRKIISTASIDDVSKRVVDAFVALICLQSLSELFNYEYLLRYRALPRALHRMRLALYHMRQLYHGKKAYCNENSSLRSYTEQSKIDGCQILKKFLMDAEVDISSATSFSVALCAAFSHLFSHGFSANFLLDAPLPISLSENEKLLQNSSFCSAQVLHLLLNLCSRNAMNDAEKWSSGLHPFQVYYSCSLFPVSFISSRLQPLFERLVLSKRLTNGEALPPVVLLAEILLYVDQTLLRYCHKESFRVALLLRVLENDICQCHLESYSQVIIQSLQTDANRNDWYFSECFKGMTTVQHKTALELTVDRERERIRLGTDMQLFAGSIGLLRISTAMKSENNKLFEESKVASLAIRDPILRILCLRHLREIVRSSINTEYYHSIQIEIVAALKSMSIDDMPLLTLALILGTCVEDQLDPCMEHLLDCIWKKLMCGPSCEEERLDQIAVFQTIRSIIGRLETPIPHSFFFNSAVLQFNSPIFHTVFQKMTLNATDTVLLAQLYLVEVTIDAQVFMNFRQETISSPLSLPSSFAKYALRYSWESHYGKLSHRQVELINSLVLSSSVELEEIPFDKLRLCTGFEEKKDRPVVENWLKYHDDQRCAQIAILAVFLLVRANQDMTPTIRLMVEMIFAKGLSSKVDSIRRGARACFASPGNISWQMNYWKWSTSMWQLLRNIMISSLGSHFTFFGIGTVEEMKNLLDAEYRRSAMCNKEDLHSHFSVLSIFDKTCDNNNLDISTHLSEVLMSQDCMHDEYIACILFHIVRKCQQKEWCDKLYELLHSLLYNIKFPNAQRAAVFTLTSQKRGRKMLMNILNIHFDLYGSGMRNRQKRLSEPELITYLIALTNRNRKEADTDPLSPNLWQFWDSIQQESVHVQRHFQACFFSHINNEKGQALSELDTLFDLSVGDVYFLHMINTSYFVVNWLEREHWVEETADFIASHRLDLLAQFVADVYTSLSIKTGTEKFKNPEPNYLGVAGALARDNSVMFCQGVRASIFGEGEFRNALYRFHEQAPTVDQRKVCIDLYSSFQVLTVHFIDMVLGISLDDFSSLQYYTSMWYEKVKTADRESIERLFIYLESTSIRQRQIALRWLLRLVELDLVSVHEVYQFLSDRDSWNITNESDEFNDTSVWCRVMCLDPSVSREHFSVLTSEKVEADFCEMIRTSSVQFM